MSDGELWQRYDAKVVQLRELEAQIARLEAEIAAARDERDRWAKSCSVLTQKLTSARLIAERLRSADRSADNRKAHEPAPPRLREEYERAREVLGLLFTALSGAWSGRDQAWRAESESGGRLLYALTRGAMASVSLDNYKVDGDWLRRVDLESIRIELGFDDGGIPLSIDDGPAIDLSEVEQALAADHGFGDDDPYGSGSHSLPPPPSFTSGHAEPALISAFDAYDDHDHDPEPENGRAGRTTIGRALPPPGVQGMQGLPSRANGQTNGQANGQTNGQTTVVKTIPAPPFRIGKLVKPTP